jgi:glycyl-tRNA synthetase beta chain
LRRAALGVIRILSASKIRLNMHAVFVRVISRLLDQGCASHDPSADDPKDITFNSADIEEGRKSGDWTDISISDHLREKLFSSLIAFFADRLKVALREKGVRHDLIDAVFALGDEDDLVRLVWRVEALQAFLRTDDGTNLLIGYKRAANILRIEEKKDNKEYRGIPDGLKQDEEIALQRVLIHAKVDAAKALSAEDFEGAMKALASLRVPVDRFFDKVTVNTDDKNLRENRLKLLSQIVETAHQVADFSKIEG